MPRAVSFFSGLVRRNPHDDASRLRWSEALVFQHNLRDAIKIVQSADGAETDPRYGVAIALASTVTREITSGTDHSQSIGGEADGSLGDRYHAG